MRYVSFHIENFKGIKKAEVNLETIGGASVFAFVGLNESGKTTLLEAIHSFSPDIATSELLGGDKKQGTPYNERVPRHLISEFTGRSFVGARILLSEKDKDALVAEIAQYVKVTVDKLSIPSTIFLSKF